MEKAKKLLRKKDNQEYYKQFFGDLKWLEFFTYGESWTPKEIITLAKSFNVNVSYCPPKSAGYVMHGPQTMEVGK